MDQIRIRSWSNSVRRATSKSDVDIWDQTFSAGSLY